MTSNHTFKKGLLSLLFILITTFNLCAETVATTPIQIDSVYQISNLAELRWVSENSSSWSSDFIITADIDATDTSTWNEGKGFAPIGNDTFNFRGVFSNKDSYIISNLSINRPYEDYIGFFGYSRYAMITGVKLENVDVSGRQHSGGLIGYDYQSRISNSHSSGSISGTSYVGGLTGTAYTSIISNSYALGNVDGDYYIGGLIGKNFARISSTYVAVTVSGIDYVGGLTGYNASYKKIDKSYAIGALSGTGLNVGGFIGYDDGGRYEDNFFDSQVSGFVVDSGNRVELIGVTDETTANMQTQGTFINWDFTY